MTQELETALAGVPASSRAAVEKATQNIVKSSLIPRATKQLFVNADKFGVDTAAAIRSGRARLRKRTHIVRVDITAVGSASIKELLNPSSVLSQGVNTLNNGAFPVDTQVEEIGVRLSVEQASGTAAGAALYSQVPAATYGRPALNGEIVAYKGTDKEIGRWPVSEFFAEAAAGINEIKYLPFATPQAFSAKEVLYLKLETGGGTMYSSTNLCFIETRLRCTEVVTQ